MLRSPLLAVLLPASALAGLGPAPAPAPLKGYGIVAYSAPDARTTAWIDQRFAYRIGGPKPTSKAVKWMSYHDIYGLGSLGDNLLMKDWARSNRRDPEAMLLHARANYVPAVSVPFSGLDRFDAFEGRNGVLKSTNGTIFTDVTGSAYKGAVNLSAWTYFGYEEPFAEINFSFSTPGDGVVWRLQYWNGLRWAPVSHGLQDGTAALTQDGTIAFLPPADWTVVTLNGSRHKYFVRLAVDAARVVPVTQRIFGDDWFGHGTPTGQGWDPNAAGVVNRGTPLAYNPTPPAWASARFPYQARIAFWASNHFVANPADRQGLAGGSWANWLASRILTDSRAGGFSGVMADDGERDVSADGIAASQTDFVDQAGGQTWAQAGLNKYQNIVRLVRQGNPQLLIGLNAADASLVRSGQWNVIEYHTFVSHTNDLRGISHGDDGRPMRMAYDDYLPVNNPGGVVGVFIYADTQDVTAAGTAAWDRGNRGPMAALSKHYVAKNDNTVFAYYSRGAYIYDETDEVYRVDGAVLHQASQAPPRLDQVQRWATYFPAMAVDIGVPDRAGHHGGVRDLGWRSGAAIGGGMDVWRRDYTRAIVLHRPAAWNSTAGDYGSYSTPLALGGLYFPLNADGSVGAAISTIRLRVGEGAILLKARP